MIVLPLSALTLPVFETINWSPDGNGIDLLSPIPNS